MRDNKGEVMLAVIRKAYNLGLASMIAAQSKDGLSAAYRKRERAALNRLLKSVGTEPLTEEEYQGKFNC
jgi:hypothetical protein